MFSAMVVPVLGIGVLLTGLWHAGSATTPRQEAADRVYLIDPDPRLDGSLTVYLRQQAKEVALCQRRLHAARTAERHVSASEVRWRRAGLMQAISDYNMIARECTPAVFQKTGMPSALTF